MKKTLIIFIALSLVVAFAVPGFAQLRKDVSVVKGKIVELNMMRKEIKVSDTYSNTVKTFVLNPGQFSSLSQNDVVIITHKKNSNVPMKLRVVTAKR
ncbi:MAG: hypothetical protein WC552_05310 [Candidatus Omnitrophota bacterium]